MIYIGIIDTCSYLNMMFSFDIIIMSDNAMEVLCDKNILITRHVYEILFIFFDIHLHWRELFRTISYYSCIHLARVGDRSNKRFYMLKICKLLK